MSEIPNRFHIPALDGWRGLAILIVLTGHFGGDTVLPGLASAGVDLFFVLSGRLMAEILFVRKIPLRLFFFRRFRADHFLSESLRDSQISRFVIDH
ncbi:acyltransferase family protein [Rhizobium lusitanum]|uniref:Peptidoglycan/LPS O-acetylase OafA/YrhL n=1 Tax=Rhizobium lusitanum TaxID=293958 RepID=A0A7X0IR05_9HYPH|nr:acyltransferase family protein [Rhizobium lusitanum]MBB6484382.1 peptidoglycan/LPS O-acetylase OafA/YrhL [Rhizobium lusitanum]